MQVTMKRTFPLFTFVKNFRAFILIIDTFSYHCHLSSSISKRADETEYNKILRYEKAEKLNRDGKGVYGCMVLQTDNRKLYLKSS